MPECSECPLATVFSRPYNRAMQRRRDHRYEVWESVVLRRLESGQHLYSAATVIDISRSGYRVFSGVELAIGAEVLITLNSVAIVGRVRHCERAAPDSFTAGVEITNVLSGVAAESAA